jgi:hypothetical protein
LACLTAHGRELDARIDDPSIALVYVETKWSAKVGTGKGKAADVPTTRSSCAASPFGTTPRTRATRVMAVLGISERKPDLAKWHETDGNLRPVSIAWLTWDELSECPEHPLADEFGRYLAWKRTHAA